MTLYISLPASGLVFFIVCALIYRISQKKPLTIFDSPGAVKGAIVCVILIGAALLIGDFFVHKHDHIELGNAPLFYAIVSFISCFAMMVIARVCRVLFKRDEDYYEKNQPNTTSGKP